MFLENKKILNCIIINERVKIILIGCSLYSIFLALNLSKKKKNYHLESSDRFLKSFSPLKIKNVYCNPGFHSFEKDRSKNIVR